MEKCNINIRDAEIRYKENVREALKKRKKYIQDALKEQGLNLENYKWNHEVRSNIINFFIDYLEEKNAFKSKLEKKLNKINYLIKNNFPQDFEEKYKIINTKVYLELMIYKILLEKNSTHPIFAMKKLNVNKLLKEIFREKIRQDSLLNKEDVFFKKVVEERTVKYIDIINTYLQNQKYTEASFPQFNVLLSNHQKIAFQFLEKLLKLNKDTCFLLNNEKEKKSLVIWNEKLLAEIYDFLLFSLENIYSAKLNEKNRIKLLLKLKVRLLNLKVNMEDEIEILIKELSEKNIYDEWYYHLYFFLSLNYLFEEQKEIDKEKKQIDRVESEEYMNKIKFKEQIIENSDNFQEIKYKVLECNRKQPNDYKERMLNIESLIIDMKSKEIGVVLPKIEKINILLYYILYLDSEYKYKNRTLLYWTKVFIKNNQRLNNEQEYLFFLRYLNLVIKESLFKVCGKENEFNEILEIKKILKELLVLLVDIPTVDQKNKFLVKILIELKNNQRTNLNLVTNIANSF